MADVTVVKNEVTNPQAAYVRRRNDLGRDKASLEFAKHDVCIPTRAGFANVAPPYAHLTGSGKASRAAQSGEARLQEIVW